MHNSPTLLGPISSGNVWGWGEMIDLTANVSQMDRQDQEAFPESFL